MLSSSERWAREVKHVHKFRDTNLLYCFALFFFLFNLETAIQCVSRVTASL